MRCNALAQRLIAEDKPDTGKQSAALLQSLRTQQNRLGTVGTLGTRAAEPSERGPVAELPVPSASILIGN